MAMVWLVASVPLFANTNYSRAEEIPKLRPPRGEIPLTFWEKNGRWVVSGGVALMALAGAGIWFLTRPKPAEAVLPEVLARRQLERLRGRAEDGTVLSRVSQALRHYMVAAFEMPSEEMTTSEFCRIVASETRIGPELAKAFGDFLRRCDERKFTPPAPRPDLGAVVEALKLIEATEARRTELRKAAACESAKPA
jgi:hypothetical protein